MENRNTNLNTLPIELLIEIFSHLTPENICTTAAVGKIFKRALNNDLFWKKKFELHFPHRFTAFSQQKNIIWYNAFHETYMDEYESLSPTIKKLFSLVKEGDIHSLKAMDFALTALYEKDKNGLSIPQWATKKKNQIILDYFFMRIVNQYFETDKKNNITKHDAHGRTLLHWAIFCNQSESIILPLIQSYDLHAALYNTSGMSAIHIACMEGHLNIVKLILQKKHALLNQTDTIGQTPILWAASRGHTDIVEYLAQQGADLTKRTNIEDEPCHGYTALHWATAKGYTETVKTLLDYQAKLTTILVKKGAGKWPIHIACTEGHLNIVKLFLQMQPSLINQTDNFGQTPILWAASRGHTDIVKYLAQQGADLTQSTNDQNSNYHRYTALHWATEKGHIDTVKALLNQNANVNITTGNGDTCLHIASRLGYLDIARALIKQKANIAVLNNQWEEIIDIVPKNLKLQMKLLMFSRYAKNKMIVNPSTEKLLPATKALKKVLFDGADASLLNGHEGILEQSEFRSLYRNMKK